MQHGVVGQPVEVGFGDAHLAQGGLNARGGGDVPHGLDQGVGARLVRPGRMRRDDGRQLGVMRAGCGQIEAQHVREEDPVGAAVRDAEARAHGVR